MNFSDMIRSKAVAISPVKLRSVLLDYANKLSDLAVVDVRTRAGNISAKCYAPVFSHDDVFVYILDTLGFINYGDVGKVIDGLLKTNTIVKSAFTAKSMFGETIPKYYVKAAVVTE